MIRKICLIGAGNVATHLGIHLRQAGLEILQVCSRTETSAMRLASLLDCSFTTQPDQIVENADLYIFSVPDQALEELIVKFPHNNAFVVHTSGSTAMEILAGRHLRYGVFYPLQTFSREVEVDFSTIPLCLEAQDEAHLQQLEQLGALLSERIMRVNSQQRLFLHIAAVFACNFTNHMYAIADDLLRQNQLDLSLLHPLMKETLQKALSHPPARVQTGPAVRSDEITLDKHLGQLEPLPTYQKIYTFVSRSISETQNKKT